MKGNALKVFFIICYGSDDQGEYKNLEGMLKYGLTYPTILSCVEVLCKLKVIEKSQEWREATLKLLPPYEQYSRHLKEFKGKLAPLEPKDDVGMGETVKTVRKVLFNYGRMLGMDGDLSMWFKHNVKVLWKPAVKLLEYGKDYEGCMAILQRAKQHYGDRVTWTLQGAVLTNIHLFINPEKELTEADRKMVKCYKLVKGIPLDLTEWEERHLNRALSYFRKILAHFKGEWKPAAKFMEEESNFLKQKRLEFNPKTLSERIEEWELRRRDE